MLKHYSPDEALVVRVAGGDVLSVGADLEEQLVREACVGGVLRDGEDEDVAELVDAAQDDLLMANIIVK